MFMRIKKRFEDEERVSWKVDDILKTSIVF